MTQPAPPVLLVDENSSRPACDCTQVSAASTEAALPKPAMPALEMPNTLGAAGSWASRRSAAKVVGSGGLRIAMGPWRSEGLGAAPDAG